MSLRIKVILHSKAPFFHQDFDVLSQTKDYSRCLTDHFCLSSMTLDDEISNHQSVSSHSCGGKYGANMVFLFVRCKVSGSLKRRCLCVSASSGPVLWHLQPGRQRSRPSHHQRHRRDGAMVAEPATVPQHRVQRGERHSGPRTGKGRCFLSECCGAGRVQDCFQRIQIIVELPWCL